MKRILGFILGASAAVLISACAGDQPPGAANQPSDATQVSKIPWNRPEQWEGAGALGGMMPGTGNSR